MLTKNDVRELILLLAVGICDALCEKKLSIAEAERVLFTPANMRILGLDSLLKLLIHKGTEFEDIESLVPEELDGAIAEVRALALQELERIPNKTSFDEHTWPQRLLDPRPGVGEDTK